MGPTQARRHSTGDEGAAAKTAAAATAAKRAAAAAAKPTAAEAAAAAAVASSSPRTKRLKTRQQQQHVQQHAHKQQQNPHQKQQQHQKKQQREQQEKQQEKQQEQQGGKQQQKQQQKQQENQQEKQQENQQEKQQEKQQKKQQVNKQQKQQEKQQEKEKQQQKQQKKQQEQQGGKQQQKQQQKQQEKQQENQQEKQQEKQQENQQEKQQEKQQKKQQVNKQQKQQEKQQEEEKQQQKQQKKQQEKQQKQQEKQQQEKQQQTHQQKHEEQQGKQQQKHQQQQKQQQQQQEKQQQKQHEKQQQKDQQQEQQQQQELCAKLHASFMLQLSSYTSEASVGLFRLWKFCCDYTSSPKQQDPRSALSAIGLTLCGPFDLLANPTASFSLAHSRGLYTLPECIPPLLCPQTLNAKPLSVFLTARCLARCSSLCTKLLDFLGLSSSSSSSNTSSSRLQHVAQAVAADAAAWLAKRKKSWLAADLSGLGINVRFNKKKDLGWRDLGYSIKSLRAMVENLKEGATDDAAKSEIEKLFTLASIAADEGDAGAALQLGRNFWCLDTLGDQKTFLANAAKASQTLDLSVVEQVQGLAPSWLRVRELGFGVWGVQSVPCVNPPSHGGATTRLAAALGADLPVADRLSLAKDRLARWPEAAADLLHLCEGVGTDDVEQRVEMGDFGGAPHWVSMWGPLGGPRLPVDPPPHSGEGAPLGMGESWQAALSPRLENLGFTPDGTSQDVLNEGYKEYLAKYRSHHEERFFEQNHHLGFMHETYNPNMLREQFLRCRQRAQQEATHFLQRWESGGFKNLRLEAPVGLLAHNGDVSPLLLEDWPRQVRVSLQQQQQESLPFGVVSIPTDFLLLPNACCLEKRGALYVAMTSPSGLSGPRLAHIFFPTQQAADEALQQAPDFPLLHFCLEGGGSDKETLREFRLKLQRPPEVGSSLRVAITPPVAATAARLKLDAEKAWELIRTLDGQLDVCATDANHPLEDILEGIDDPCLRLDLMVTYLRHVHCVCYYSGKVYDDPQQLHLNALAGHLRPTIPAHLRHFLEQQQQQDHGLGNGSSSSSSGVSQQQQQWLEQLDQRLDALLHMAASMQQNLPPPLDENESPIIQSKWTAFCEEHTSKDSEGRFRCTLCQKLFKAPSFVHLHHRKKHERELARIINRYVPHLMKSAYLNDPNKHISIPQAKQRLRDRELPPPRRPVPSPPGLFPGPPPPRAFGSRPPHLLNVRRQLDWDRPTAPAVMPLAIARPTASYDDL
ncbi:hypothetical protein Esti_000955 [Eimeria stiedai]